MVLSRCLSDKVLEVAKLKADPSFSSEEERVKEFVRRGHGCRATYFSHAQKLSPRTKVPRIRIDEFPAATLGAARSRAHH